MVRVPRCTDIPSGTPHESMPFPHKSNLSRPAPFLDLSGRYNPYLLRCQCRRSHLLFRFSVIACDCTMRGFAAFAVWLCAFSLAHAATRPSFRTVETENGRITGHRSAKVNGVWEYLGIPYAQPPLGDLRFAAPQKYNSRNGSYRADNFVRTLSRRLGSVY